MPMRGKLPPPPGSKSRPLPPEPPAGSEDAPPPLPSRPGQHKAPAMKLPPPPRQPESPESSDDEGITYEEPNEPTPPVPRHIHPEPVVEQETYDEFEGMGSQGQTVDDDPGETYDACDIQDTAQAFPDTEESVYEEGDTFPDPPDGDLYEFMPEEPARRNLPPPPMPSHSTAPSLPSRPPPSRQPETDSSQDSAPDLPGRPTPKLASVKRLSGEGQKSLGISLHELGARKANLKKVESREEKEEKLESTAEPIVGDSVKDKINKFKQVEKGVKPEITAPKPLLPVKPMTNVTQKTPEVKPSPAPPSPKTPSLPPPPPENFDEPDDIYDEGFSYVPDPLSREEWYHGDIERNESTKKLQSIGQDGTFLVRKSKQGGDNQPYTLVVLYLGHVYNLKMRLRSDGQIALGEAKADELAFKDVPALIQHHKEHDVILVNVKENKQHKTLLKKHPISMSGK